MDSEDIENKNHIEENVKLNTEIEEFFNDIYNFLKNEIQYNHYENDLNHIKRNELLYIELYERCEKIIKNYTNNKIDKLKLNQQNEQRKQQQQQHHGIKNNSKILKKPKENEICVTRDQEITEASGVITEKNSTISDNVYLDMFSKKNDSNKSPTTTVSEYIVFNNFKDQTNHDDKNIKNDEILLENNEKLEKFYDNYENYNRFDYCLIQKQQKQNDNDKNYEKLINNVNINDISLICPYIGLPAAHLNIYKSIKHGKLLRIEKRLFFEQIKKYYCGIISNWLLCYPEGISLIRPTLCIHLKDTINIELYGLDNCYFHIIDNETSKKISFQAQSSNDAKEWYHTIKNVIGIKETSSLSKSSKESPKLNSKKKKKRKKKKNHNDNDNNEIIEDVYEVPNPLNWYNHTVYENKDETEYDKPPNLYFDDLITNENKQTPTLFNRNDNNDNDVDNGEINDIYDIPSTTQQNIETDNVNTECNSNQLLSITKSELLNKSEFQNKIKDIHVKLSSSGSIKSNEIKKSITKSGISVIPLPILSQNDNNDELQQSTTTKITTASSSSSKANANIEITSTSSSFKNVTPMKNWFLNRLGRSSMPSNKIIKLKEKHDKRQDNSINLSNDNNQQEYDKTVKDNNSSNYTTITEKIKGCRINKIINQLEANGHLPMITKSLNRSHGIYDDGTTTTTTTATTTNNLVTDNNGGYEPIMMPKT